MSKPTNKTTALTLTYPSPKGWAEVCDWLTRSPKYGQCNIQAVQEAVQQAVNLFAQIRKEAAAGPEHGAVLKKAKRIRLLLSNLARELQSEDAQHILRVIKADHTLARLLSFSAVDVANPSGGLSEPLDLKAIAAFELQSQHRDQVFSLSALDRHFERYRRAAIGSATGETMHQVVAQLQVPFDDWLSVRNKGGRPVVTAPRALLFCLIKEYEAIFERPMDKSYYNRIMALAAPLFPACGLPTDGLEEATKRALNDFAGWSVWHSLEPISAAQVGPPNSDAPDDDEPPMTPAKPRAKS